MIIDTSTIKREIKPKADSTLLNMRKKELIEYIRILEHNYNTAVWFNENQARYVEKVLKEAETVIRCKDCKWWNKIGCAISIVDDSDKPKALDFCSFGEKMDLEEKR